MKTQAEQAGEQGQLPDPAAHASQKFFIGQWAIAYRGDPPQQKRRTDHAEEDTGRPMRDGHNGSKLGLVIRPDHEWGQGSLFCFHVYLLLRVSMEPG